MTTPIPADVETWEIDGLLLGSTVSGVPYIVDTVTGWDDAPKRRPSRSARPTTFGSFMSTNYQAERVYTVAGWAEAGSEPVALSVRDRLTGLCPDAVGLYALRHIDSLSGENRTAWVALDDALVEVVYSERPLRVDFSLQFTAPDPRKHGATATTTVYLPTPATGGLDATAPGLDATAPGLSAGTPGLPGFATVGNGGTAPASPLFVFSAGSDVLVNPRVTDNATGQGLRYNGALLAGETLYINCDSFPAFGFPERSVLLGGTADRGNRLAITGDWPVVSRGGSATYAFGADNTNSTATLGVTLRSAWW